MVPGFRPAQKHMNTGINKIFAIGQNPMIEGSGMRYLE